MCSLRVGWVPSKGAVEEISERFGFGGSNASGLKCCWFWHLRLQACIAEYVGFLC